MSPPSHLLPIPSFQIVTEPLFEFPESYSKFPLAIYFTYGIVNFCYPLHTSLLLPPSIPPCPQVCSLCLFFHCCPENKFISIIFLDSIYTHQYMLFIFLFLTCFTCIIGSSFIYPIKMDSNAFLFMAEQYSIVYMYHSFFVHSSGGDAYFKYISISLT